MPKPRDSGSRAVSIPFRADTGFEQKFQQKSMGVLKLVSIPFRADTGFEQKKRCSLEESGKCVSIPFRADTGFEQMKVECRQKKFVSCFNPFQG